MRDVKQKIHFVPDCVAITHTANRTWNQIVEFTNRQMIMTFHMGLWAQWLASLMCAYRKASSCLDQSHFYFTGESCYRLSLPFSGGTRLSALFKKPATLASGDAEGAADD